MNQVEPAEGCPTVEVAGSAQDCTLQKIEETPSGDIQITEFKDTGASFTIELPKPTTTAQSEAKLVFLDETNAGCYSSEGTNGTSASHLTYFTYANIFSPIISPSPKGKPTKPTATPGSNTKE